MISVVDTEGTCDVAVKLTDFSYWRPAGYELGEYHRCGRSSRIFYPQYGVRSCCHHGRLNRCMYESAIGDMSPPVFVLNYCTDREIVDEYFDPPSEERVLLAFINFQ